MTLHFECTMCGKCCHDLKLPLTVREAVSWLQRGHAVEILCDGLPWQTPPGAADALDEHRRLRSFAGHSGEMAVRVSVILAAAFDGPCPNLQTDLRCGIYDRRPLVCRIYPAEIRPGLALQPGHKACPPEAWSPRAPLYIERGQPVSVALQSQIAESRATDRADVVLKERLCDALALDTVALADEGVVIHALPAQLLLDELLRLQSAVAPSAPRPRTWTFISNRRETVDRLQQLGAQGVHEAAASAVRRSYRGFHAPQP